MLEYEASYKLRGRTLSSGAYAPVVVLHKTDAVALFGDKIVSDLKKIVHSTRDSLFWHIYNPQLLVYSLSEMKRCLQRTTRTKILPFEVLLILAVRPHTLIHSDQLVIPSKPDVRKLAFFSYGEPPEAAFVAWQPSARQVSRPREALFVMDRASSFTVNSSCLFDGKSAAGRRIRRARGVAVAAVPADCRRFGIRIKGYEGSVRSLTDVQALSVSLTDAVVELLVPRNLPKLTLDSYRSRCRIREFLVRGRPALLDELDMNVNHSKIDVELKRNLYIRHIRAQYSDVLFFKSPRSQQQFSDVQLTYSRLSFNRYSPTYIRRLITCVSEISLWPHNPRRPPFPTPEEMQRAIIECFGESTLKQWARIGPAFNDLIINRLPGYMFAQNALSRPQATRMRRINVSEVGC